MTETFLKVTLIMPRKSLPLAVFGMSIEQAARPERTVPAARSGLKASVAVQVATPLASALPVSLRVISTRTTNPLPAAGLAGTASGAPARRLNGGGGVVAGGRRHAQRVVVYGIPASGAASEAASSPGPL